MVPPHALDEEHFRFHLAGGRSARVLFSGPAPTQAEVQKVIDLMTTALDQYPGKGQSTRARSPAQARRSVELGGCDSADTTRAHHGEITTIKCTQLGCAWVARRCEVHAANGRVAMAISKHLLLVHKIRPTPPPKPVPKLKVVKPPKRVKPAKKTEPPKKPEPKARRREVIAERANPPVSGRELAQMEREVERTENRVNITDTGTPKKNPPPPEPDVVHRCKYMVDNARCNAEVLPADFVIHFLEVHGKTIAPRVARMWFDPKKAA